MTTTTTRPSAGLLVAGAVAAPLFTVAALAQAALRPGYDLTRHPVSMLANGDLGWLQTGTFLICGALMLAGAVGLHRALTSGRGRVWGPILFTTQGIGLLVAGAFRMDPGDGFPIGTPAGAPTTLSGSALVHNAGGSLAFLTMIAACLVLARRFTADRAWAVAGRTSAVLFAVGLGWAMTGGRAGALTLFVGVVIAWGWLAASLLRLSQPGGAGGLSRPDRPTEARPAQV